MGYTRLATFLGGALLLYLWIAYGLLPGWLLVVPLALFFVLGGRLQSMEEESRRLRRAEAFYERGLARLDGEWAGTGNRGERFVDEEHLYARDLDLFGEGSLFELSCGARTRMGEETLAAWLLHPAAAGEVVARQESVRELAPNLDLREDVAVLGEAQGAGVHAEELAAWGDAPPFLKSSGFRLVAVGLSILGGVTIAAALGYVGALSVDVEFAPQVSAAARAYFLSAVLLLGFVSWRFNARAEEVFGAAGRAARDVDLLADVLRRIEAERFESVRLASLRAELDTAGEPPSRRIARLHRLMDRLDQRDNMMVRFIGPLVLWDVHLAYALEAWRAASGPGMGRWLRAVGEIEALSSLAEYHYERPGDVFPEVVPAPDASASASPEQGGRRSDASLVAEHPDASLVAEHPDASFAAEHLAHPLLGAEAVANDIVLGASENRVLLVSGSNMSGKSTLLRTVGVAAVLAQAGAPVRARRLRMTALAVGASIRVSDSLRDGESRFYAEILRLRSIVEAAGAGEELVAAVSSAPGSAAPRTSAGSSADSPAAAPVLFLIDEFLHGTNSHDRRIGAEAIVRGLVDRGAIGLVTTHDLALTHIADALGELGANVHFEDHLEDGRMRFDYRMRPGVVQKSNALELMRSVGLDV